MYATDEPLAARIRTHELYTQPKIDFAPWVLDHVPWQGSELVLDVGCGSGFYVEPTHARLTAGGRLIGADLSLGILRDLAGQPYADRVTLVNADAMGLPLPDACCDVLLANHMLYHVPQLERALAEFRRVLRPGGYLVAATNSRDSMEALIREMAAACQALGYPWEIPPSAARTRFTLENGAALIEPFFPQVEQDTFESALIFPAAVPAVAYVHSTRHVYAPQLPQGLNWEALMAQVERQVQAVVAAQGEYRVPKTTGVFVATRNG